MKHPILITECPTCGKMTAARSPYLEVKLDADGKPDPNIGTLITINCDMCTFERPIPIQEPSLWKLWYGNSIGIVCYPPAARITQGGV